jgi:cytochrome oxidase Cu insertion factor (SCO1/SenC/PrrC family)
MTMRHPDSMQNLARAAFIATLALVIITGVVWGARLLTLHRTQATVPANNNYAIAGFPLSGRTAPDFQLTNQFNQPVTLASLRGHEVVLAFIDSRCTTLCPLTAEILYNAKSHLTSSEASQIELIAINANPIATSIPVIQDWSIKHGMLHQWQFLTGSTKQLKTIYQQYDVADQVSSDGAAIHDPATFIIDANGNEQLFYETLNSTNQSDLNDQIKGLEAGMRQWLPHQ